MAYESDHSTEAMIEWIKENDPEQYDRLVETLQDIVQAIVPIISELFQRFVECMSGADLSDLFEQAMQKVAEILRAARRDKLRPPKYIRPTKTFVFDKRRLIRTYRQGD